MKTEIVTLWTLLQIGEQKIDFAIVSDFHELPTIDSAGDGNKAE